MAKVLLVEDDNNLREIYEARLAAEGYEIATAKDGEDALAVAKQFKPDLVISDVMMPRISGFEMLDILRNTDGLKHTKVIMLTALGQAEDKGKAENLGADRYLVKSQVTLEDIVKAAEELLNPDAAAAADAPTPATPSDDTLVSAASMAPPAAPQVDAPVSPVATPPAEQPAAPVAAAPAITTPETLAPAPENIAPAATPVVETPTPEQPQPQQAPVADAAVTPMQLMPDAAPQTTTAVPTTAPAMQNPAPAPTDVPTQQPAVPNPAMPAPAEPPVATTPTPQQLTDNTPQPAQNTTYTTPQQAVPSDDAATAAATAQSTAQETAAIEQQIENFENVVVDTPIEAAPTDETVAAPTVADQQADLITQAADALAANVSAESTVNVPAPSEQQVAGGQKVIQPLPSAEENKTDLNTLLAQEQARENQEKGIAGPTVVVDAVPVADPSQAIATPASQNPAPTSVPTPPTPADATVQQPETVFRPNNGGDAQTTAL